jgi:hypothetical protein
VEHSVNRPFKFLSDSPIEEDRFGRAPFARALAGALVLPADSEGLVVGIEGAWGSGKTFVINQIKSILGESNTPPIVVEFNPWIISGTDSLVEALLEQLCSAIGEESDPSQKAAAVRAGSSVLRYLSLVRHLRYLKYVPGVSPFGQAAEDLSEFAATIGKGAREGAEDLEKLEKEIPRHSLEARKRGAVKALADLRRPIVVILDDIDRLPPEEIRSVFQAVKAVANFPRTAYLLSYDPTIAARALDREVPVGLSYLEKIVQVQYSLPLPLPWRVRAFVLTKLRETLAETRRALTPDEEARLDETASYVARLCRTPRDAIRICNRLRISLPSTENEVDACDVVLLEAIGVCERDIDDAIRQWPEDFTEPARIEFEDFGQDFYFAQAAERMGQETEGKDKETAWRKRIQGPLSLYAEGALRHLFPENRSSGTLRVQNWDRLYRFLALGPSEFIVEIRDLRGLIADERALQNALSSDDKSALSVLRSIELYQAELQIADEGRLINSLCLVADARLNKNGDEWGDLASQYADVIKQVVRRSLVARKELMEYIIDVAPISISQALITEAASDLGLWPDKGGVSADKKLIPDLPTYKDLLGRWIRRVEVLFSSGIDLRAEPIIYAVLYRLGQLGGDYVVARAIAKKLLESGDLHRFMRSTQLAGEFGVTYGHLEIIERDTKNVTRYQKAINFLRSEVTRDYFKRRSTTPTTKWPPE